LRDRKRSHASCDPKRDLSATWLIAALAERRMHALREPLW